MVDYILAPYKYCVYYYYYYYGARRGHTFKLFKKYRLDVRKFKFASRVYKEWNRLRDGIVSAGTVHVFKMSLF